MSERRFYFRELLEGEWTNPQVKSEYLVTESELEQRIYKITNGLAEEKIRIDTAIDILLHGEKEQSSYHHFLKAVEDGKQPDEWEEWLSRCPTMYLREWFTDMVQILRRKP